MYTFSKVPYSCRTETSVNLVGVRCCHLLRRNHWVMMLQRSQPRYLRFLRWFCRSWTALEQGWLWALKIRFVSSLITSSPHVYLPMTVPSVRSAPKILHSQLAKNLRRLLPCSTWLTRSPKGYSTSSFAPPSLRPLWIPKNHAKGSLKIFVTIRIYLVPAHHRKRVADHRTPTIRHVHGSIENRLWSHEFC